MQTEWWSKRAVIFSHGCMDALLPPSSFYWCPLLYWLCIGCRIFHSSKAWLHNTVWLFWLLWAALMSQYLFTRQSQRSLCRCTTDSTICVIPGHALCLCYERMTIRRFNVRICIHFYFWLSSRLRWCHSPENFRDHRVVYSNSFSIYAVYLSSEMWPEIIDLLTWKKSECTEKTCKQHVTAWFSAAILGEVLANTFN